MKSLIFAAATLAIGALAYASEPVDQSSVEARRDALEKINVTSIKPVLPNDEAKDADVDAILQRAADAEAAASDDKK